VELARARTFGRRKRVEALSINSGRARLTKFAAFVESVARPATISHA
jgi:hypothetical protein